MGLADLRVIDAPQLGDGVEVYAEILSGKPMLYIATEKEQLTVFEPAEIPEGEESSVDAADSAEGESEPEADPRFSDKTPIR